MPSSLTKNTLLSPSPVTGRFADPAAALRQSQNGGGDHFGRGGSSDELRGQIAARERGRVAGEAPWG